MKKPIFNVFLLIVFTFLFSPIFAQRVNPTTVIPEDSVVQLIGLQNYNPVPATQYQRVFVPLKPVQDSSVIRITAQPEEIRITTSYSDEMGRPLQKVVKGASPTKKDYVSAALYESISGQVIKEYLPFVQPSGNAGDGKFKASALYNDSVFYKTIFPTENFIYNQTLLDASPLQRVQKSMGSGNAWVGQSVGKTVSRRANTNLDSVRLWTIDINNDDDLPQSVSYYVAGSLMADEVFDENGARAISYKDELGHVVLTKQQVASSPGTGLTGWLCTYYVYDEVGHQRMVIPPKAIEALAGAGWSFTGNTSIASGLCYSYFYDVRGRVTVKAIPGKGKSYIAYDLLDRVVLTQDANLRQNSQWAFVKYDDQDRPFRSGIITSSLSKEAILSAAAASSDYPTLSGTYTITTEMYYDDYAWVSGTGMSSSLVTTNITSANFYTTYNASPEYAQPLTTSSRIRGSVTGAKKLILGSTNYLYSLVLYDDKGRVVQTKSTNYSAGTDIATQQYSFSGQVLRTHLSQQKGGTNTQTHTMLTKMVYDHAGRAKAVVKNLDATGDKTIALYSYNELGQVTKKVIAPIAGGGLDSVEYNYNIRGWLTGLNKDYVASANNTNHYFGEALFYESGWGTAQKTGNIAGVQWKSGGDGIARSYAFDYDKAARLTGASFAQQNEGSASWTLDKVDFSVSGISYDAGGNILSMKQRGLVLGTPATIDSLSYQYFTNTNQLQKVSDGINEAAPIGDFKDTTLSGDDYAYDVNGNINKDYNRHLHTTAGGAGAVYNLLDKPDSVCIAGKNTVYYYYDASGAKLAKKVNDYSSGTLVTKTWLYLNGFVYLNDTLQYTLQEEGRVRWAQKRAYADGVQYFAYEWDYFLRDHLGNVRTVLTEGRDTAGYIATMEPGRQAVEDALFANAYTPVNTQLSKPSGFDADGSNQYVARLNASSGVNKKTGPALVLKVMKGDRVQLSTYAFYNTATQSPGGGPNLLNDLLTSLSGGVVAVSGGHQTSATGVGTTLSPGVLQFFSNQPYNSSQPKAYLNWILFNEQMQYVSTGSSAQQVSGAAASGKELLSTLQDISKSGYLYVYVSNESPQDVFFDDLSVKHYTGPLLQEQSYSPYGLEMQGISSKAFNKFTSQYKFNGGVELEEELNIYSTFYRQYDQQIGRFTGVDILSEKSMSAYGFGDNNPVMFNDPLGDLATYVDGNGNKWHSPGVLQGTSQAWGQYDWASNSVSYGWGEGPGGFGGTYGFGSLFGGGGSSGSGNGGGSYGATADGFTMSGSYAQAFVAAFQNAYNHPGLDGSYSLSFGTKSGGFGFWQSYAFSKEESGSELAHTYVGVNWVNVDAGLRGYLCTPSYNWSRVGFPQSLRQAAYIDGLYVSITPDMPDRWNNRPIFWNYNTISVTASSLAKKKDLVQSINNTWNQTALQVIDEINSGVLPAADLFVRNRFEILLDFNAEKNNVGFLLNTKFITIPSNKNSTTFARFCSELPKY